MQEYSAGAGAPDDFAEICTQPVADMSPSNDTVNTLTPRLGVSQSPLQSSTPWSVSNLVPNRPVVGSWAASAPTSRSAHAQVSPSTQ